jgi:nitrogen fixation NifU-like protein
VDVRELYQETILDHNRRPRNFHKLDEANRVAEGYNPLCGDKLTIYLKIEDSVVKDISFQGSGCAISMASASMMTQSVKEKTVDAVHSLFENFHNLLTGKGKHQETPLTEQLGKLGVFAGVLEFPARVKCATLPWHTLRAAMENRKEMASTE